MPAKEINNMFGILLTYEDFLKTTLPSATREEALSNFGLTDEEIKTIMNFPDFEPNKEGLAQFAQACIDAGLVKDMLI